MGLTSDQVAELYRRYGASVYRRCRRILRDDALAHDALQEVFVRLWRYGAELSEEPSTLAWFNRVAERCCFDLLNKRSRSPVVEAHDDAVPDTTTQPFAERVADLDAVARFLTRLDARSRSVAVHYFIDELEQDEIAARLSCTRKTVYNCLQTIKHRAAQFGARLRSVA